MDNRNYESLFQKIGNCLNAIIPTKWKKIFYNIELYPDVVSYHYCFYDANIGKLVQHGNIEKEYGGNRNQRRIMERELINLIKKLNDEYAKNNQERWTTMTFILQNDGKFNIDYGYEDLYATSEMDRRELWEKKYLDI